MSSVTQVITGNHRLFLWFPKPLREKYLRGTLSSTCFFCYAVNQHKHVGKVGSLGEKHSGKHSLCFVLFLLQEWVGLILRFSWDAGLSGLGGSQEAWITVLVPLEPCEPLSMSFGFLTEKLWTDDLIFLPLLESMSLWCSVSTSAASSWQAGVEVSGFIVELEEFLQITWAWICAPRHWLWKGSDKLLAGCSFEPISRWGEGVRPG